MEEKKKKGTIKGLVIALMIAIAAFLIVIGTEYMLLTKYEKVSVVAAKKEIPAGTFITASNKSEYFGIMELPEDAVQDNAVKSLKDIKEYQVPYDMQKKEQLTKNKILNVTSDILKAYENPVEASLKVDNISKAVSGTLRGGDRVDIVGYVYSEEAADKELATVLENVYVSGVYDTSGVEITVEDGMNTGVIFNFILEKSDYGAFASAVENGGIQLIKVSGISE